MLRGVCCVAGGWSHLPQLFGLMKGSHTLLSAQKVPTSTSHLILRLLQQVAVAAAAAGLRLDVPCALPESQQASQEGGVLPSQEQRGHKQQGTTFLSLMLEVKRHTSNRDLAVALMLVHNIEVDMGRAVVYVVPAQIQCGPEMCCLCKALK